MRETSSSLGSIIVLLSRRGLQLACDPADGSREGLPERLGRTFEPSGDLGPAQLLAHQVPDCTLRRTEPALDLRQGRHVPLQQLACDQALTGSRLGADRDLVQAP